MLAVKTFKLPEQIEEFNEFLKTARLPDDRIETHDGLTYVYFVPDLEPAELERISVGKRLREAKMNLVEALLHKAFLDVVKLEDMAKIEASKSKNALEIANLEEQIKMYKTWRILSS